MISSVFTSQIFGKQAFYAPISIQGINILKTSIVIAIIFEHVPQLFIQIYVFDLSVISIVTLIVSIVDVLFVIIKGLFWCIFYKTR